MMLNVIHKRSEVLTGVASPITRRGDLELQEEIRVADIVSAYRRYLSIDVSEEFRESPIVSLYRCRESGLRFFYPVVAGSEAFYEKLQRNPWYYLETKPEYDFARQFIADHECVLEVGCGSGNFGRTLRGKNYLGLEFSEKAQRMASANGLRVLKASVEEFSLTHEESYDVVCAFQVLEHVPDAGAFIDACIACLRPGGLLIYSVPNLDSYLARVGNGVLNMPPHHTAWWTESVFRRVAALYRLEIVEIHFERLADMHVPEYAALLARETLLSMLGGANGKRRLIDLSLRARILNRAANYVSKPLRTVLADVNLRPVGHSITAVLRKTA